MKYFIVTVFAILFLGSCKKTDSSTEPTLADRFKKYEGTWQVAETPSTGTGTLNYTCTITVNNDGSITITNLGRFHKTISAAYRNNGGSDVHDFLNILVDISSNTTMSGYFTFQEDATVKSMSSQLTYYPNGGSSTLETSVLNAVKE